MLRLNQAMRCKVGGGELLKDYTDLVIVNSNTSDTVSLRMAFCVGYALLVNVLVTC